MPVILGTISMIVLLIVSYIASWSIVLIVMGSLAIMGLIHEIKSLYANTHSRIKHMGGGRS